MTTSNILPLKIALLVVMLGCSTTHAWAPAATTRRTAATRTQLAMAWSLPAPMQRTLGSGTSYWYQDCGTAVGRRVVYDDSDEDNLLQQFWWDEQEQESRGLAFARLNFLKDAESHVSSGYYDQKSHQDENAATDGRGFFPIRMARGIWKRIRGSTENH
ncbi:expressed unknown protein [Seminavis robusta]|uniref:Uncharacterized protein n=1 Tax=Seminavis robusta TaxID=568900 RepID=A0A9N8F397_9STRA|nr:expressed unknown protein [Seminavis robusta]|eukprot:Sro3029_g342480.1 n/a (159) ;mRNA; f:4142-4618